MSAYSFDVNLAEFNAQVIDASFEAPVLVDFWAEWCQPCRILKPMLEKLAQEYQGRFRLAKVNSDHNAELAKRYGVRSIPTVKAFVDGQLVNEFSGALPERQVREFIENLLPSPAEPLRLQAFDAQAAGDLELARKLMAEAIDLDPRNDESYLDFIELSLEVGAIEEAQEVMAAVRDRCQDKARVEALAARLELAASGSHGADLAELQAAVDADPADLAARLQLANAQAVARQYREALQNMLTIVRQDRHWQEDAGRKAMLTLFALLATQPDQDDLVREFRATLSRTLN